MNNQILLVLKNKLVEMSSSGILDAETQRNALKEELQFYVLNFIYHHTEYGNWIMYGGSVLRICHGLDRMSVDLDFEVSHVVVDEFLEKLKKEIEVYFKDTYDVGEDVLFIKITSNRGLTLRFNLGEGLEINHPSKQIHVKIDLNHFVAPKTVTERIPINRNQLSFVIRSYNMSSLMASKIAAIFLRGQRGVGGSVYEEKGRDIYDLIWYMTKNVIPDLDYLIAKKVDVTDLGALFDKLTLKMNNVSYDNLKQDLSPLFLNQTFINNWLSSWLETYLYLLKSYHINKISGLSRVEINQDFHTDNFYFTFFYNTNDNKLVKIICSLSDYWLDYSEGDLSITPDDKIKDFIKFSDNQAVTDKLIQYITVFYQKIEAYFKRTNNVMLGNSMSTKTVRMTATNLNQQEQIVLNRSALLSCELDDLLR